MLHNVSLLDELRKGGYEACLVSTFNAYFPFYEEVVLPRLISAGVRHNVLIMDGAQYASSIQDQPPESAGRSYSLVPIDVSAAFHPKLVFLVGPKKGLVAVGSHNMTISGFGYNRELTNIIRVQEAGDIGISIAAQAWDEVQQWIQLSRQTVPSQIAEMVSKVADFAPWLKNPAASENGNYHLLSGRPGQGPLWQQLTELIEGSVKEIYVVGAFFDRQLAFLKQLRSELNPDRFFVAIDPETVDIPASIEALQNVSFVHAGSLGNASEDDEKSNRYLHAKGLYISTHEGETLLVTGSANPSRPAWLEPEQGANVELMIARVGKEANAAAKKLGILAIPEMPPLNDNDWQTISANLSDVSPKDEKKIKYGVAVIDEDSIYVDQNIIPDLDNPSFTLIDSSNHEIATTNRAKRLGDRFIVVFAGNELENAIKLNVSENSEIFATFLLHHKRLVEEQARTGTQRRFKQALQSLHTDSPDLGLLLECIDKIVFSDASEISNSVIKRHTDRNQSKSESEHEYDTLAIDVSETKKKMKKKRLSHDSDFAYLLDALIYHLGGLDNRSREDLDRYGRNEEEQIGEDDEDVLDDNRSNVNRYPELLDVCHRKVHTVISRMVKQLHAYKKGEQTLDAVVIRLLGVLAVLRELRKCDGRVVWVEKGKTTVPVDERKQLFEVVMMTIFEGKQSLLHLEELGDDFENSDDISRLKGLLLWLAWESGIVFDLQKPFRENKEAQETRLKNNAMILALAQAIHSDEAVKAEARQSIAAMSTSELEWLKDLIRLSDQCDEIKTNKMGGVSLDKGLPGDVAIHNKLEKWDLSIVSSCDGQYIDIINLNNDKPIKSFKPEHISMVRLL